MSIRQIVAEIHLQLAEKYPEREIESFVRILFKHYLNISPPELYLSHDGELPEEIAQQIFTAVDELRKYRPIQYITGKTEFYGLQIDVTPDVLIPRPETEELVDWIVREYERNAALSIVDIGAGSGCIAVALKSNFPNANVWAADISEGALSVARRNAENNNLKLNYLLADVLKEDMMGFEYGSLDVVVSNPPYVTPAEQRQMQPNVLDYEPHVALFTAGSDPFIFFKHIAAFSIKSLKNGGKIFFEINEAYPEEVTDILKQHYFSDISARKDINGKWRMVSARRFC